MKTSDGALGRDLVIGPARLARFAKRVHCGENVFLFTVHPGDSNVALRPWARRRARRLTVLVITATVVAAVLPALAAQSAAAAGGPSTAYRANDYADGQAMSILPPGENGLANAADLAKFELTGQRPPASHDQLGKYENLLYGSASLTDSTLSNYYNDESFGVPSGGIVRTEAPAAGVTIYRDVHDIPHIYGDDRRDVGLRCRIRPSRGPAVPDGRAAALRRGYRSRSSSADRASSSRWTTTSCCCRRTPRPRPSRRSTRCQRSTAPRALSPER